ncbi:MAG: raffinose/stachyose/melibiose transport system substrate-binding protein [Microbacteriaceae bacterium]|jgi:ABC-type glycerol-3-phosphate transport system substrate-binding protein|nr:raffinose/stachyose/melibiose transport system substrate-binding protein [Microbacteriaceae bacterium]
MMFQSSVAKRRRSTLIVALGVATSLALALVGCSSSTATASGSATSGKITWWGWTPEIGVGKQYIAAFNKVYPNITVTYKQVATASYDSVIRPALASSVGPDVFNMAPGGGIGSIGSYQGSAVDLTPVVTKALGSNWKSKVAPIGPSGLTTSSGKLAALSVGSTFAGPMWINPDLFAKYNLTPPKTLDEWISTCQAFKSHGVTCFEQGAGDPGFNMDLIHAISDSIQPGLWTQASTGKAKWTNPVFVQAWTIFQKMFSNGIMQTGALGTQQYPDVNNDFLSGKTAMVMMGTWYMQYSTSAGATAAVSAAGVANAKPFPVVSIPFPDVAGKGNPAPLFGDADFGLAVNVKSKQQKAAETFVTWLATNEKAQQVVSNALNDISALTNVSPSWPDITLVDSAKQQSTLDALIKQAGTVTEPRLGAINKALGQALGVASASVAGGKATPQQALATLQATPGIG